MPKKVKKPSPKLLGTGTARKAATAIQKRRMQQKKAMEGLFGITNKKR